jgi:hypothetical protein
MVNSWTTFNFAPGGNADLGQLPTNSKSKKGETQMRVLRSLWHRILPFLNKSSEDLARLKNASYATAVDLEQACFQGGSIKRGAPRVQREVGGHNRLNNLSWNNSDGTFLPGSSMSFSSAAQAVIPN